MQWASGASELADPGFAAEAAAQEALAGLGPGPVDLVITFFGAPHVPHAAKLAESLRNVLQPACLIGASAHGVVTAAHEIEGGPSLSVLAARLPGVEISPFVVVRESWGQAVHDPLEFARAAPGAAKAELVMLITDPFSLPVENVLTAFNRHAAGTRIVGGMASAGVRPNSNAFILNDWVAADGGIALGLSGAIRADVVVSQGCHPIGPPLEVTRTQGNVLVELDGQPALERAEQVLRGLGEAERERLRNGLYIGRPVRAGALGPGDYLIRNLLGADRDRGLLAIGDRPKRSERVRLHVRDAESARDDLEMLLMPQSVDTRAAAMLVFPCNGRGKGLYGKPDGDVSILRAALGDVPAAGMFCAGEFGPLGGPNHLHGHTASIAILRAA
jgi:small ligand-binding sensory domain FIST